MTTGAVPARLWMRKSLSFHTSVMVMFDQGAGKVKEFYNPPGNFCGGRDTNF